MVALAFAAAATRRICLHTHVYVAAYRNPFLAAKGVATLQNLSGGRVILGVAARLPAARVRGARRRLRRAQRPARRDGDRSCAGRGRRRASRSTADRFTARGVTQLPHPAPRPDLDRRQQRSGDAASGGARRRLVAVPQPARRGSRGEDAGDHERRRARDAPRRGACLRGRHRPHGAAHDLLRPVRRDRRPHGVRRPRDRVAGGAVRRLHHTCRVDRPSAARSRRVAPDASSAALSPVVRSVPAARRGTRGAATSASAAARSRTVRPRRCATPCSVTTRSIWWRGVVTIQPSGRTGTMREIADTVDRRGRTEAHE